MVIIKPLQCYLSLLLFFFWQMLWPYILQLIYFVINIVVLQTINAVMPHFTPDSKPGRIDYSCPLLEPLNNTCEVLPLFVSMPYSDTVKVLWVTAITIGGVRTPYAHTVRPQVSTEQCCAADVTHIYIYIYIHTLHIHTC